VCESKVTIFNMVQIISVCVSLDDDAVGEERCTDLSAPILVHIEFHQEPVTYQEH
jgi:hypothetical protein